MSDATGNEDASPPNDFQYVINRHHRNGNVSKSQWTISEAEETGCFNHAKDQGWIFPQMERGWGLHIADTRPSWLGIAQDRATRLFIAKFVGNVSLGEWHGYPADYRRNNQDIPDEDVLRRWLSVDALSASKIRKIAKGQPCNL